MTDWPRSAGLPLRHRTWSVPLRPQQPSVGSWQPAAVHSSGGLLCLGTRIIACARQADSAYLITMAPADGRTSTTIPNTRVVHTTRRTHNDHCSLHTVRSCGTCSAIQHLSAIEHLSEHQCQCQYLTVPILVVCFPDTALATRAVFY